MIEHQLSKNHAGQIAIYLVGDKTTNQHVEFPSEEELQAHVDRDHDGARYSEFPHREQADVFNAMAGNDPQKARHTTGYEEWPGIIIHTLNRCRPSGRRPTVMPMAVDIELGAYDKVAYIDHNADPTEIYDLTG